MLLDMGQKLGVLKHFERGTMFSRIVVVPVLSLLLLLLGPRFDVGWLLVLDMSQKECGVYLWFLLILGGVLQERLW